MKMGLGFWVVAAAAGVGGYLAYRGLREMEKGIREEIAGQQPPSPEREETSGAEVEPPPSPEPASEPATLESRVLNLVRSQPGWLQVDLYREFDQINRKELQELLLHLARAGKIRRIKEGSTYKLYPA